MTIQRNTDTRTEKSLRAASELEDLVGELRELIEILRKGTTMPYAHVYAFRKKVSKVVSRMGDGPLVPERVLEKDAERILFAPYKWEEEKPAVVSEQEKIKGMRAIREG